MLLAARESPQRRTVLASGLKFAALRRAAEFSQDDFAKAAEVSSGTVSRIEQAEVSSMFVANAKKFAKALAISLEDFESAVRPLGMTSVADKVAGRLAKLDDPYGFKAMTDPEEVRKAIAAGQARLDELRGEG